MIFHTYSPECDCDKCESETSLQRMMWKKAQEMCNRHQGRDASGAPCDICLDVISGADSEDPVLHGLGVMIVRAIKRNCA